MFRVLSPGVCPVPFDLPFFYTPDCLLFHRAKPDYVFEDESTVSGNCQILLYLFRSGDGLSASYHAPYGQVFFSPGVSGEMLEDFLSTAIETLKKAGEKSVSLTLMPRFFDARFYDLLANALLNAGFSNIYTDYNQHLEVSGKTFQDGLHLSEKRKWRKLDANGYKVETGYPSDWNEIYLLIKSARDYKGFPVTIEKEVLAGLAAKFPDYYVPFVCRNGGKPVAFAMGVRETDDSLYYFMPASSPTNNKASPAVAIIGAMYEHALKNKFKWLNLGTSSVEGVRNEGLFTFKSRMGAVEAQKGTFKWDLLSK